MAAYDYERALRIERWPLVEVLHAYQHIVKEDARRSYEQALSLWASMAHYRKAKQPQRPPILDD